MSLINIMWSSGAPFASVHKVHHQIISQLDPTIDVKTWFLKGKPSVGRETVPDAHEWCFTSRQLKGRGIWRWFRPFLQSRLKKSLAESAAQVVLLDGLGASRVLLPVIKKLPDLRVVVVFHGATRFSDEQKSMLQMFPPERLTLAAVSATLAGSIQDKLQMPVQVLRSALDPEAFCHDLQVRQQARQLLGLPDEEMRIIGAVGRLVQNKGFDYLVDAFSASLPHHPDLKLVIVGEGPDREALERKIKRLGLTGKVFLPGHRAGLAQLYRGFDWVVIPSREEGLGLVLQEAVIAGVPVLSSDLEVFREQLGDAGHYVPVADVPAWVAAIDRFARQEGSGISASQYQALGPEQAWQKFRSDSLALLAIHR